MRTVKIQGGLGNQLFGVAFARSLALASGAPVALDVSSYRWDRYGGAFMVQDLVARIGGLHVVDRPWLGNRLIAAAMRRLPFDFAGYATETIPFPDPFDVAALAGAGRYFDGYWQHEDYILDGGAWPALFGDFVRARAEGSEGKEADEAVIHFRTYKEENHPVFSRTPDRDYFLKAVAATEAACGPLSRILLVSDDLDIARRRIGDIGREVVAVGRRTWAADMALMLNARALILTNSSFSWWGGYCGRAGIVTYPAQSDLFHYPIPARRFARL